MLISTLAEQITQIVKKAQDLKVEYLRISTQSFYPTISLGMNFGVELNEISSCQHGIKPRLESSLNFKL